MPKRVLTGSLVVATLTVASLVTLAQAPAPAGHWEGAIQIPNQELKVEVDLTQAGEKWDGTITIPAQSVKGFPLSSISVQPDGVSFVLKSIPGDPTFRGTVSADAKTLSGTFSQGAASFPFTLTRTGDAKIEPLPKSTPVTKEVEGTWDATLDTGGAKLRLTLKLANQPGGAATGTIVSLDQGSAEVPIGAVVQTGTHLELLAPTVAGSFKGDLKEGQLVGTWTQGPRTWPLVFSRPK